MWSKPKKIMSEEERRKVGSSDISGDIPGTYISNMSNKDLHSWKGRITGIRLGHPQIEVRKYPFVMILSNGGYKHGTHYTRERTKDKVFHLSTSGVIQFTSDDLEDFFEVIKEMQDKLQELEKRVLL